MVPSMFVRCQSLLSRISPLSIRVALGLAACLATLHSGHAQEALRDLDTHCPFHPPATLAEWEPRADELRLQLQVATGLYPPPQLDPVQPQVYGKLEKDGYTIEKCVFESLPGFFVTGNLYRPTNIAADQQLPGVLCPHGHWTDARFYAAQPAQVRQLLASGAERFEAAAQNHIQARCVQLARMGCVVYHWDMIGYCDATQISYDRAHRFANQPADQEVTDEGWLLFSPLAESHLQSVLGLQALAITRAVDMLLTLPEVDPARIAITGASGGGTQSFLGAALDERISVAFPAVMVSTGMQGGCTCENACLLRTGTGNVEMAALIAPRPLGLTAANDWTKTMPNDGFPQLQQLYQLFDAKAKVALFPAVHFDHNFNHVSRVAMYGWLSDHFQLGYEKPVLESDFEVTTRSDLTVWDAAHPQPPGGEDFERQLLRLWSHIVDGQLTGLLQGDQQQNAQLAEILADGWRVALGLTTHVADALPPAELAPREADADAGQLSITSAANNEVLVIAQAWPDAQPLVPNPRLAAAYTYGYNLPVFAQRAQQVGKALCQIAAEHPQQPLRISGSGRDAALAAAGLFCAQELAAQTSQALPEITLAIAPQDFRFAAASSIRDPQFLPGSARYWDLPGLVACLHAKLELAEGTDAAPFERLSLLP